MKRFYVLFLSLALAAITGASLKAESRRYAVILSDPPAAQRSTVAKSASRVAVEDYRRQIVSAQTSLRRDIESRRVPVTGSVQTLLNAMFVRATLEQAADLRGLAGVKGVVPLRKVRMSLNRAVPLAGGPGAWAALGGTGQAGAGVKIAIIDSGIDTEHPAFGDASLPVPAGFPKCLPQDCAFTNRKIIVARSYVALAGAGTQPNPAADSRPDDTSSRDRVGHGTALAMVAAGGTVTAPLATITGMAPKAWLGNYKVFGSPSVNDGASEQAIIAALEDAVADGMDVAVLSLGSPAPTGPLDEGQACGQPAGTPCDLLATAAENAVRQGMTVVAAAGNEGNDGVQVPTLGTVGSPANAPSVIAVGAVTNSRVFGSSVRMSGDGVPDNLKLISALLGDGNAPADPLTAPLRDVTASGNDGLACTALPPGSLTGTIALIQRGNCYFFNKAYNAAQAGAVGVVFYLADGEGTLISPGGLSQIPVPVMMIGNTEGHALKDFLQAKPDAQITMDPALTVEVEVSSYNTIASFSSHGPTVGTFALKPEIVAVGTNVYTAAQRLDAGGVLYSPSGYVVTQGTSFSAPLVAGAAALVKQKNPGFTPAQVKSALVDTASQSIRENDATASAVAAGAGGVNAGAAVLATVTAEPAALSFGELRQGVLPLTVPLVIRNTGNTPVSLTLPVSSAENSSAIVTLEKSTLSLSPGQSESLNVTLSGSVPAAGLYEGAISVLGAGATLRVPYLFVAGDGVPYNLIPLAGSGFVRALGDTEELAVRVIDQFGVPVRGSAVQFSASFGGGSVDSADAQTDAYGVATAKVSFGQAIGTKQYVFRVSSLSLQLGGRARLRPAINTGGIVNAASFEAGAGAAPGSYVAIFGLALGDAIESSQTAELPPGIGGVSVSFEVPSANISLPGRLSVVAPGQVNTQVPWELAGQSSVLVKVSNGELSSDLYELPLARYSPGVFEYLDRTARQYFAAALDEDNVVIGGENGARPGRVIQLFVNGLGPVDHYPESGSPTPYPPLSRTLDTPAVTIAGRQAAVEFNGLTPSAVGLYQINAIVPPDTPSGIQPLVLSIGGVTAKSVNLLVR